MEKSLLNREVVSIPITRTNFYFFGEGKVLRIDMKIDSKNSSKALKIFI